MAVWKRISQGGEPESGRTKRTNEVLLVATMRTHMAIYSWCVVAFLLSGYMSR